MKHVIAFFVSLFSAVILVNNAVSSCIENTTQLEHLPNGEEVRVNKIVNDTDGPMRAPWSERKYFLYYRIEYTLDSEKILNIFEWLDKNNHSQQYGKGIDQVYIAWETRNVRSEIEDLFTSGCDVESKDFREKIQKKLDSIHLEYLPDFTITISNRWFQNGNE
jgi:hypothetical protein